METVSSVGGEPDRNGAEAYLSTIYRYDHPDRWALLDARMKEGKYEVIAMMLDQEMLKMK
jgi:hypothetical protein